MWMMIAAAGAVALCDLLRVIYYRAVALDQTGVAALISPAIYLLQAVAIMRYVKETEALVAVAIGSAVGTVLAMKLAKWQRSHIGQ